MKITVTPIVATTSLSVLLHGVAVSALLVAANQMVSESQAVGQGLDVELVSSIMISDHQETDMPEQRDTDDVHVVPDNRNTNADVTNVPLIATVSDEALVTASDVDAYEKAIDTKRQVVRDETEGDAATPVMRSTDASADRHSILELLHSRISNKKEYPYLAKRQRREGIATVAFTLNPDGSIENTHMISSSQVVALDRAALSAVNSIQPFVAAQNYLQTAEDFQVDIVFELL